MNVAELTPAVRRRGARSLCWLAAVLNSAFLLAPLAHSHLPAATSYSSELEAAGQPHAALFRLLDATGGAAILLAAALGSVRKAQSWGWAALALVGIGSVLDAAAPMSCAPSVDTACRRAQDSTGGLLAQLAHSHTQSSLVGFLASAAAMLMLAPWLGRRWSGGTPTSRVCAAVTGALGLIDVALILTDGQVGLSERARLVVFAGWLILVGNNS